MFQTYKARYALHDYRVSFAVSSIHYHRARAIITRSPHTRWITISHLMCIQMESPFHLQENYSLRKLWTFSWRKSGETVVVPAAKTRQLYPLESRRRRRKISQSLFEDQKQWNNSFVRSKSIHVSVWEFTVRVLTSRWILIPRNEISLKIFEEGGGEQNKEEDRDLEVDVCSPSSPNFFVDPRALLRENS